MKPSEQTKINNAQAQLESLEINKRIANEELEKVLEEKQNAEEQLASLFSSCQVKQNEIEKNREIIVELEKQIQTKTEENQALDNNKIKLEAIVNKLTENRIKEENNSQESSRQILFKIEELTLSKEVIENAIIIKSLELKNVEKDLLLLKKEKSKETKLINDSILELNKELIKVSNSLATKNIELETVKTTLSSEKSLIGLAEINIQKERRLLDQDKSQVEIMKARMKIEYSKMHPDRTLKI